MSQTILLAIVAVLIFHAGRFYQYIQDKCRMITVYRECEKAVKIAKDIVQMQEKQEKLRHV